MTRQFADPIDQANEVAQNHTDDAIAAVRRAGAPEQDPNDLDPYCCDCGSEIEEGRLALLKKRCFACQTIHEKKEKMRGRG